MDTVLRMLKDNFLLPFSPAPSETIIFDVWRWSPSLLKRTSPSWRNFKCSAGYDLYRHVSISTVHLFLRRWDLSTQASLKHSLSTAPRLLLQKSKNSRHVLTAYQEPQTIPGVFMYFISSHPQSSLGKKPEEKLEAQRDKASCSTLLWDEAEHEGSLTI